MNNSIYLIPIFTILFIFTCAFNVWGQCPPNQINLYSQQDVDNFAANYPNCTQSSESIYIGPSSDITDLSPLSQIEIVSGNLTIRNNSSLTSLDGLENLFFVTVDIEIENNPALTDISALSGVIGALGVRITNNPALTSLSGFENITGLSFINISDMPLLTDLADMKVTQNLNVLFIRNTGLMNLSGLENVSSIYNIFILENNELNDISALESVNENNLIELQIINNSNLSVCYVQNICDYIAMGGDTRIYGNLPGCNSPQEVQASCLALPVELTHFTAEAQRGSVLLKWQTASETNNQGFDGINWEKIGYQQGAGNSITAQDYRHSDTQPLSGINYYRLKQIDVKGDFIYSDVASVSYGDKGFAVFPVPAKDEITLQLESPQTAVGVRIINIIGEVIHLQELHLSEGVNQVTFDISEYTKGIYFLTIDNGDKNGTQRFVKH